MYEDYEKLEKLKNLQDKLKLQDELPHLFGHKLYPWQRIFLECMNFLLLLTAANQIGKSSVNIKKIIKLATSPHLWPKWWPKLTALGQIPRQMWYLYPDAKVATAEWHEKWVPEFMPKGSMKDHPQFGWTAVFDKKLIQYVKFNTGVTIYFKTYSQNAQSLQSGTVSYIGCDEELPFELYDELKIRLSHTDGYFACVFTATLNQIEWAMAMEPEYRGTPDEKFPNAQKMQISLYDCMTYEDGSPSLWTKERIQSRVDDCGNKDEVLRRIFGRFIFSSNKKYFFIRDKNVILPREVPKDWFIYAGVDIGTGGEDNHPAAIAFVAVNPEFTKGEVFLGCRMDGVVTTSGDILTRFMEMRDPFEGRVVEQRYDSHARDFWIIADRLGETFLPANKKHDEGEDIVNTLFKHEALTIHATDEHEKLITELRNLLRDTDKRKAKDDFIDALRYAVVGIPWDMTRIKRDKPIYTRKEPTEIELRRAEMIDEYKEVDQDIIAEINEWNALYGS